MEIDSISAIVTKRKSEKQSGKNFETKGEKENGREGENALLVFVDLKNR